MGRQLGALSGLAMVLIVLNHSIHLGIVVPISLGYPDIPIRAENFLSILQGLGAFAVPTFLFISGSFVAYAAKGDQPKLSRKFLASSLRHILIPYFIWSVLSYLFFYLKGDVNYTLVESLKNLVIGFPYHFIPLLAFYYLISPVLVPLIKRVPVLLIGLIAMYQFFLLNMVYSGVFGFTFPEWARYAVIPVLRQTMADWGIFFPLGLVYGLNTRLIANWSKKFSPFLWFITFGLFVIAMMNGFRIIEAPFVRHIALIPFILIIPGINRGSIPFVKMFENIGRKSYGLYLTHRFALELVLMGIQFAFPILLKLPILLFPLLFSSGLFLPLWMMEFFARGPAKRGYRYLFG